MASDELVTISEAVKRLENKYTGSYLLKLAKGGKIDGRQSGTIWLVDWPSVEKYSSQDHPRGGSVKGWKKRQQKTEAAPVSTSAEEPTPAPQETLIEDEGAQIWIEALRPDGQRWLEAKATQGDMQATMYLRPYGALASVYTLDKRYDRLNASAPGRMGRKQEYAGQYLLSLLEKHMRAALVAAGWHTEERAGNELWRYRPRQKAEGSSRAE